MKTISLFRYLMIATLGLFFITSCSDDDKTPEVTKPKVKTAEEIAAENLAEFKKVFAEFGNCIGVAAEAPVEWYGAVDGKTNLKDLDFKNLTFEQRGSAGELYFKLIGDNKFELKDAGTVFKGDLPEIKKEGDELIMPIVKIDLKDEYNNIKLVKVVYNTKTKIIMIGNGMESNGMSIAFISKFKAKAYTPNPESKLVLTRTTFASRAAVNTDFAGTHKVYVKMESRNPFIQDVLFKHVQPWDWHYVKMTKLENTEEEDKKGDRYQIQFCDADGKVSGNNDADYLVSNNTHHFWANKMPMALNFENVSFTYYADTKNIKQGRGVKAKARKNGNKDAFLPFFFKNKTSQESNEWAAIITTENNSADHFTIKVKLGFEVDVTCVITKE